MQVKAISADEARAKWGEMMDTIWAGEVVSITRHGRPLAIVINPQMWEQILSAYERLDDAEDRIAGYRAKIKRLTGQGGQPIPHEQIDAWLAEDEKVLA